MQELPEIFRHPRQDGHRIILPSDRRFGTDLPRPMSGNARKKMMRFFGSIAGNIKSVSRGSRRRRFMPMNFTRGQNEGGKKVECDRGEISLEEFRE